MWWDNASELSPQSAQFVRVYKLAPRKMAVMFRVLAAFIGFPSLQLIYVCRQLYQKYRKERDFYANHLSQLSLFIYFCFFFFIFYYSDYFCWCYQSSSFLLLYLYYLLFLPSQPPFFYFYFPPTLNSFLTCYFHAVNYFTDLVHRYRDALAGGRG